MNSLLSQAEQKVRTLFMEEEREEVLPVYASDGSVSHYTVRTKKRTDWMNDLMGIDTSSRNNNRKEENSIIQETTDSSDHARSDKSPPISSSASLIQDTSSFMAQLLAPVVGSSGVRVDEDGLIIFSDSGSDDGDDSTSDSDGLFTTAQVSSPVSPVIDRDG